MRHATVTIGTPDALALDDGEFLAPFAEAGLVDLEVLSCKGRRGGVMRVTVESEVDGRRLDELESVEWWERVSGSETGVAYVVELDTPGEPDGDDVTDPLATRVTVHEDAFSVDLAGSHEAISEMLADYRDAGAEVTLDAIREYRPTERPLDALTPRQDEVLRTAYGAGYYDVPRSASTEELAAELGLDPSTVAEHLQRAERNLLSTVLGPTP